MLPFQSRLELDNKPDHDAIKDLVAGGVKTYICVQWSWWSYGRQQLVLHKTLLKLTYLLVWNGSPWEGGKIDNDQESGHGVNQHFQISLKFFRVFSLKRCLHLYENFMLNWHLRITNNKVCVREWFLDNFLAQSITKLKLSSYLIHPPPPAPPGKPQLGATFHYEFFCPFPQNAHHCTVAKWLVYLRLWSYYDLLSKKVTF